MALFELPKKKVREFVFTEEMTIATLRTETEIVTTSGGKVVTDKKTGKPKTVEVQKGILDESQVRKFSVYPELLMEEIDNEEKYPSLESVEKDIFDAVMNDDIVKFLSCVARVGTGNSVMERIYTWILNKDKFTKRDLEVLKRLEGSKSIFNIFSY